MNKHEVAVTVLVIDNDPAFREHIAACLNRLNYRVVLAADGDQGIDCFHSSCPDLVLCDLDLPGRGGLDTLRGILAQAPDAPIILLASEAGKEMVEAMKLGISDYLLKPVDNPEMLGISIANTLKRSRLIAENNTYRRKLELINREL